MKMIQTIKNNIAMLIAGVVLLLASAGVSLAAPALVSAQDQVKDGVCTGAKDLQLTTNPDPGACQANAEAQTGGLNRLITQIINIITVVVGIVAVIMIIVGGFRYITSGGDSNNVGAAKNTILYAIVGLIIVALAQVIVRFVLGAATTV
jgi:hypothetical protein